VTLEQVVARYVEEKRPVVQREKRLFAAYSLPEAIRQAASKNHGTHQYRLPRAALPEASRRLLGVADRLTSARTFRQLIEFVQETIQPIRGIGDLTVYDVALRIGYKIGLAPELVYLHAGAAVGAAAVGVTGRTAEQDAFPPTLRRLNPAELENCLCIYKNELWGRPGRNPRTACSSPRPNRAARC
jgi:hypothetical protein